MIQRKPLLLVILVGLTLLLSSCASNKTVIRPITDKDIYHGKNPGDVCFSAYYIEQVLQVKIER